jgi:hypothetical protein
MTIDVDLFSVQSSKRSVVTSSGLGGTVLQDSGIGFVSNFYGDGYCVKWPDYNPEK